MRTIKGFIFQIINRILWGYALPDLTVKSGWTPYVSLILHNAIHYTMLYCIYANLLGTYLEKWGNQSKETVVQGELNTVFSIEVQR